MKKLVNPIGVFDAGVGSLSIANAVQEACPQQDVIWLADRESFPLGSKTKEELLAISKRNIDFLVENYGVQKIIVAANVLSVMVLPDIIKHYPKLEIHGVLPPVEKASKIGDFGILGVAGMVKDQALKDFTAQNIASTVQAQFINASPLIDGYVENGAFISLPNETLEAVSKFMDDLDPMVKVFTLSSTHLPWLLTAFQEAKPEFTFLAPAREVTGSMEFDSNGSGTILALTTENMEEGLSIDNLNQTLKLIGQPLKVQKITL